MSDGPSIALIRDPVGGKNMRVREGDQVQGWRIVQVEPNKISLVKKGEKEIILNMFHK